MALFVGRVSSSVRSKDVEDLFRKYGTLKRCEVKGTYAFVTYDDERDADDAMKALQGHDLYGSKINIEWTKGSGRYSDSGRSSRSDRDEKRCFTCGERGHFARDCRRSRRRSRSRSRSRRRRSRSRSRSKSRSRDRRRSRSRSRERRRDRRSRSRSRGRDRSKDRRSKERSKSRERSAERERSASRSRSRGRKRERSASPAHEDEPDTKRQKLSPSGGDDADQAPADENSHKED